METWQEGLVAVFAGSGRMVDDDDLVEAVLCHPLWDCVASMQSRELLERCLFSEIEHGR